MNPLRAQLWSLGVLASWYLRDDQKPVYQHLHTHKNPFIEAARRYGKTTTILAFVLEKLRQNPGWVCRWCEPWKFQAREIVMPEMDKLQADCPRELRFHFRTTDSVYVGPGGSRFYLRGVNDDKGESARGPFANILVADEFGSWDDPEYIVNSALRPQLQNQAGGIFIFASTPSEDLGHPYYIHKELAIREGRFIQRTIHDNKSLTAEQIAEECKNVGGAESAAWRREYLCEPVSDPEALVVPEFSESFHVVPDTYPRPEYFDAYVSFDLGFQDQTAALFAYYDFQKGEIVIEDEDVAQARNSEQIVATAKLKEKALWGDLKPYRRVSDNDLQQIHDMGTMFGYSVTPTRKDDKEAAINELRVRFSRGKIRIKERCRALRFQLKVGMWNEQRTGFRRGKATGHLDAIDALIYLNRNVNTTHNPWPQLRGASLETHHFTPQSPGANRDAEVLKRALRPFRQGGT